MANQNIKELYKKTLASKETNEQRFKSFANEMIKATVVDNLSDYKKEPAGYMQESSRSFPHFSSVRASGIPAFWSDYLRNNQDNKQRITAEEADYFCWKLALQMEIKEKRNNDYALDHNTVQELIDQTVKECSMAKLSDILSCNDFMEIFNSTDNDNENKLTQLLDTHKNVTYQEITEAVKSSSLSDKDKKRFFAEVLPKYNFKVCNNFQATWDMFEKGYIDFDTLVTKFWARNDFDKNDQNLDRDGFDKNDQNSDNAFRNFASFYKNCVDRKIDDNSNVTVRPESLNSSVQHMINNLGDKGVIADNDKQNLTNQINSATNVGVVGIIAQFFKNLFSKDKKAFKPIQQTKQDRIISNLKPLSGILRRAAEQQKNAIQNEIQ